MTELEAARKNYNEIKAAHLDLSVKLEEATKTFRDEIAKQKRGDHLEGGLCAAFVFRDSSWHWCTKKAKTDGMCGVHVKHAHMVKAAKDERARLGIGEPE